MRKLAELAGAGITGVALLPALHAPASGEPAPALSTMPAVYQVAPRERTWDGTVEAVHQATVSAQTSGRVAEINYDVDDFVEAGATIMRFTDTEQRAALRSARAAAGEAEARHVEASNEFRRVSDLYANETVSRARLERARANRDAARARLESAQSVVTAAQQQLDYTVVRAPYAGIVSDRHVEVGELVAPGQPLMSGLSLNALRVSTDVPQSLVDPIRKIGKAYVYVGQQRIEGENLTFFPIADPASNTFRIRVELPADSVELYPGMFVKVGFVVGESQRLLIPGSAVVRRSELTAVYVAAGAQVELRQVRIGRRYGEQIEVLAGLAAGEAVAVDPVAAGMYLKRQRGEQAVDGD